MSDPAAGSGAVAFDEAPPLAPRGTVVVLLGRGEDPSVYERLGRRLSGDAWRVRVTSGHDDETVRSEVELLLADPAAVAPVVLLGSDSGAARAVRLAVGADVAAVVLGGLLPADGATASFGDFDAELVARTSCPAHRARLSADPAFVRNALAVTLSPEDLDAPLSAVGVPVLALHGGVDPIAPPDAAVARYRGAADVEVFTTTGGVHDVFNDITHRVSSALVVLFLERVKAGRPLVQQVPG
ncbi:alpha/beta hydrolase [uncultured Friedmanniella sp.]|uniref:alpha/beta hydrolase n=1 Tax=uncultured Friedmanniella sp. TaxID=335381 RepID=UPI0035CA3B23